MQSNTILVLLLFLEGKGVERGKGIPCSVEKTKYAYPITPHAPVVIEEVDTARLVQALVRLTLVPLCLTEHACTHTARQA